MQTNRAVPVEGKVVYYKTDGTGRDSYIHNFNGGLLSHDHIHRLKQFQPPKEKSFSFTKTTYGKHPFSFNKKTENKFVHYISDGSGRDFYVTSNEGGNSDPYKWRNETGFKFRNSLRGPDKFLEVFFFLIEKNPEDQDIFQKSQLRMTATQSRWNRSMSMTQTMKNSELSAPKKVPTPPPIDLYFQKGFDTSREFRKQKYGKNH